MSLLYAYLYILLQEGAYSLLFGSIGLTVMLATTMYLTRKVDWYELGGSNTPPNTTPTADLGSVGGIEAPQT